MSGLLEKSLSSGHLREGFLFFFCCVTESLNLMASLVILESWFHSVAYGISRLKKKD